MKVKIVKLDKWSFLVIKIPYEFQLHPPKPEKVIEKTLKFSRESELEDIIVDEDMNLLDGYCSYLIAQQVGVEFVKIKQIRGVKVKQSEKRLKALPGADVVEVVRCEECEYYSPTCDTQGVCILYETYTPSKACNDFCSDGERKEGAGDG